VAQFNQRRRIMAKGKKGMVIKGVSEHHKRRGGKKKAKKSKSKKSHK
jgi:hypothetical protein